MDVHAPIIAAFDPHHDADPAEDAHARERLGAEAAFRSAVGETASDLDAESRGSV